MLDIQAVIAARRDGRRHSEAELHDFAGAAGRREIPDYQLAAWLMAAYIHPLNEDETAWLTLGMADSGERLDLTGLPKPWVDKHSTGGVGDKTSLVVLPILAACGLTMVKMSGRGLGITGGTLDKLSAVPGLRLDLTPEEAVDQAGRIGLVLTGQSPALAPADKELYALRDATETVGSIPLIVSSILSKKLAGGAETIVIDVKCGSGAFMTDLPGARNLALALTETGKRCGVRVHTEITDMSQPLGGAVGNALEVLEAIRVLRNEATTPSEKRFEQLCLTLAQAALTAVGSDQDPEGALRSGKAKAKAETWFIAQGAQGLGVPNERLVTTDIFAPLDGWIARIDAGAVGAMVIELGGGRRKIDDIVDLQVGATLTKPVGFRVDRDEAVLTLHSRKPLDGDRMRRFAAGAIEVSPSQVEPTQLFLT